MKCLCEQKETRELKIEGDVLPISNVLKMALKEWIETYGTWIDWEQDKLVFNGIELEEAHNKQGLKLTEQVRSQLSRRYQVRFSATKIAKEVYKA